MIGSHAELGQQLENPVEMRRRGPYRSTNSFNMKSLSSISSKLSLTSTVRLCRNSVCTWESASAAADIVLPTADLHPSIGSIRWHVGDGELPFAQAFPPATRFDGPARPPIGASGRPFRFAWSCFVRPPVRSQFALHQCEKPEKHPANREPLFHTPIYFLREHTQYKPAKRMSSDCLLNHQLEKKLKQKNRSTGTVFHSQ